jgi:hypothetical protein
MSYRSLVLATAALSLVHVASAGAQSVYVAPGGVYVGSGPVYVIPAPNNGLNGDHAPAVVAPSAIGLNGGVRLYGTNGGYNGGYNGEYNGYNGYNGGYNGHNGLNGYYEPPAISAYATAFPPRPPALVPHAGRRCVPHAVYSRWRYCD